LVFDLNASTFGWLNEQVWRADTQFCTKRHSQNVIFDGIGRRMVNTDMKDIGRRIAGIWSLGI
jgi:hypothetical protein